MKLDSREGLQKALGRLAFVLSKSRFISSRRILMSKRLVDSTPVFSTLLTSYGFQMNSNW